MGTLKFTVACHKEISDKIEVDYFLDNIPGIDLSKFTDSLNDIFVVFQAMNPSSKAHIVEEHKRLRRKTKTLELYLVLDYKLIMQGTEQENLQHIKEVLLKGYETFIKPLKGVEWEKFYEEVKALV